MMPDVNSILKCKQCGEYSARYDPWFDSYVCNKCGTINREHKQRGFEIVSTLPDAIKSNCKLPTRSTMNSAGYDFYYPGLNDIVIEPGEQEKLWTGIKAYMQPNEVLLIFDRSSLGIKQGLQLPNSVGVIDSDYYNNPDNEGEICVCLKNISDKLRVIHPGDKIAQGIFTNYLIADNDTAADIRTGGIGSTGK